MTISREEKQLLQACDAIFDQVIGLIEDLVRSYPVLNQEQDALEIIEYYLKHMNMAPKRVPMHKSALGKSALYAPVDWDHENKYNLVATRNHDTKGPVLVLNGHLDVVPASPFSAWRRPPDTPYVHDGWLYGRGSGDMLAGVAAMIYAVHAFDYANITIRCPLVLQAVVEEECTGNGTLACLQQGYDGDFVLIPEPFGPAINAAQVGVLWFDIWLLGKPVHVESAHEGDSAIELAYQLIQALKALEVELNTHYRLAPYDRYEHPFYLNIGQIEGGDWASSVAAQARIHCRLGFPPNFSIHEMMQKVQDTVQHAARTMKGLSHQPKLRFNGFRSPGHLVDLTSSNIKQLAACHRELLHSEPEYIYSTATTDLTAFHYYQGTNGTCYGPTAQRIHGIDECVNIESIRHTLRTYALFIHRYGADDK